MRSATASQDEESEQEPWPERSDKKTSYRRSKNAVKSSRKIELGWIHDGKQVRAWWWGHLRYPRIQPNQNQPFLA